MTLQPITGIPSGYRAPIQAVELQFGQGPSNAPAGERAALYVVPKLSTGTAVVNAVYRIRQESDVSTLGGSGSPGHRSVRFHLQCWREGEIYVVFYDASSGSGITAASGTITVTVPSSITAAGLLNFRVCGERMGSFFRTTSTPTTIGDDIAAQINAKTWLPVTASNSGGDVTLTAKVAGASMGDGTVGVIRFAAEVEPGKGVTVATSGAALGLGTGTPGVDGATTENTNLAAALAAVEASRYYYKGFSVWSSTHLATIKAHTNLVSTPNPGLRCRSFTAYTHTLSAVQTLAIAVNYHRQHIAWQKNSEHDTAEIVGQVMAAHQAEEAILGKFVPDNYRGRAATWQLLPAASDADWPDIDDINDAVVDGVMPIGSNQTGSQLIMSVNTQSKNSAGIVDDFKATETHRVSFLDWIADTWLIRHAGTFQAFKLQDDERLPNGAINHNQELGADVLTPSIYAKFLSALVTEFSGPSVAMLQRPAEWKASISTNIDPDNVSRLEAGMSGRTTDIAHQVTLRVSETTPG